MHDNYHRADLALKDALKEAHAFLDMLSDGLQHLAAYYNSSLVLLKGLREFALDLGVAFLKFDRLQDRRWAAFAYGALRSMRRSYPVVVCALDSKKPRDSDDQVKQQEVLCLITSYTFVASLHFMLDVVGACADMSQIMQLKRQCVALDDLSVEKCVEVLERAERWEGPGWTGFQTDSKKKTRTRSEKNVRTEWLTQ